MQLLIKCNINETWKLIFNAYCEQKEKLDLKKIFANPSIIKTDKYNDVQFFILIGNLTEEYLANKNQDTFNNCLTVLSELRYDRLAIGLRIMNNSDAKSCVTFWTGGKTKIKDVQEKIIQKLGSYIPCMS